MAELVVLNKIRPAGMLDVLNLVRGIIDLIHAMDNAGGGAKAFHCFT